MLHTFFRLPSSLLISLLIVPGLVLTGCGDDDSGMTPDGGMMDGALPDGFIPGDGSVDAGVDGGGMTSDLFTPPVITTCAGDSRPSLAAGTCEVIAGEGAGVLLTGDILTPGEVFRGGQVFVGADGMIACVGCDCAAMAGTAPEVSCPDGVISPGLINGHDHVTFANGEPYATTGQFTEERYEHRNEWRRGLSGHFRINSRGGSASRPEQTWLELRQLISGTTSIFGSGGPLGLLRNLDSDGRNEGLGDAEARYQTFPLGDSGDGDQRRTDDCMYEFRDSAASIGSVGNAYVPHVAEGISAAARNEFNCIREGERDLVQPISAFIHGVGLLPTDIAEMAAEEVELIWSPRTNITLYGDTARVTEYARLGATIGLGTDWIASGSMNMLRELACVDGLNQNQLDGFFPDEQIWLMATRNTAKALGMEDLVGTIATGMTADIAIFDARTHRDHRAVIMGAPEGVALVMRGSDVMYGDAALVAALRDGCEELVIEGANVCGVDKRVCLQEIAGLDYRTPNLAALIQTANFARSDSSIETIEIHDDPDPEYPLFFCGVEPEFEPSCVPRRFNMDASFPDAVVNGSNYYTGMSSPDDMDGDGVVNAEDNCVAIFNPIRPIDNGSQADDDDDGIGDACDVCPLGGDDDPATCIAVDLSDRDGDGIPNAEDNCPTDANPLQEDNDDDGKGNACDACPDAPNPGAMACPAMSTTVYAIRMGDIAEGLEVNLGGLVVTGLTSNGFHVQQEASSADYDGVDFSGIFVFTGGAPSGVARGDVIDVTRATYTVFNDADQLSDAMFTVTASGMEPAPLTVAMPADIETTGSMAAALANVVVRVEGVTVTAVADEFGQFAIDAGLLVGRNIFEITPSPAVSDEFGFIQGPLAFTFMENKILPRDMADVGYSSLRISPSALTTTLDASVDFTVFLPAPAGAGGASVTMTIAPAGLVTGPATIVVPAGMTFATATYTASATAASGTVTAAFGGDMAVANVDVIEAVGGGLIISEYVEGPSNNKAIELYNGEGSVDLSTCQLLRYTNGGSSMGMLDLSGTLAAGETWVLCNSSIADPTPCDVMSGVINHNGNDSYELICAGMVIDSFGKTDEDPGAAGWMGGGLQTMDYSLRRLVSVTSGDTNSLDAFDPSVEWEGTVCNTGSCDYSTLGSR